MITMDQALRDLFQADKISYEDALARAMNPEELKKLISSGVPGENPGGNRTADAPYSPASARRA
jgi:Tfp pilus assembly ATPase PilU